MKGAGLETLGDLLELGEEDLQQLQKTVRALFTSRCLSAPIIPTVSIAPKALLNPTEQTKFPCLP